MLGHQPLVARQSCLPLINKSRTTTSIDLLSSTNSNHTANDDENMNDTGPYNQHLLMFQPTKKNNNMNDNVVILQGMTFVTGYDNDWYQHENVDILNNQQQRNFTLLGGGGDVKDDGNDKHYSCRQLELMTSATTTTTMTQLSSLYGNIVSCSFFN